MGWVVCSQPFVDDEFVLYIEGALMVLRPPARSLARTRARTQAEAEKLQAMSFNNLAATHRGDAEKARASVAEDEALASSLMSSAKRIFQAVKTASTVRALSLIHI